MSDAATLLADFDRAMTALIASEKTRWVLDPADPGLVMCELRGEILEFRLFADGDETITVLEDDIAAIEVLHRGTSSLVLAPDVMNPALLARIKGATCDADAYYALVHERRRSAIAALAAATS